MHSLANRTMKIKFHTLFIQEIINCFGFFAPLSLLAIFLNIYNHIPSADVAVAMLVGSLTSRWGRILFAPLLNRLSVNLLISAFQFLGAVGYIILAYGHNFTIILLAMFCIGLFYGNNSLINSVLVTAVKTDNAKINEKFAALHVATNLAAGLGPVIVSMIYYSIGGIIAFYFMALMLFISSIYSFFTMKGVGLPKQESWFATLYKLFMNKQLWGIYLLIIISWFSYAQLFSLAPLIIAEQLHLSNYVWIVAATNSCVIILFSVLLHKTCNRLSNNIYFPIFLSFIFAIAGFICLSYAHIIVTVILGIILISFAELMFIPGFSAILSTVVDQSSKTAIFAINALCVGIGEGMGYYYGVNVGFSTHIISNHMNYFIFIIQFLGILILLGFYKPFASAKKGTKYV